MTDDAESMVPVIVLTWEEFGRLPSSTRGGHCPRRADILEAYGPLLSPSEREAADVSGLRVRPQLHAPLGSRLAFECRGPRGAS